MSHQSIRMEAWARFAAAMMMSPHLTLDRRSGKDAVVEAADAMLKEFDARFTDNSSDSEEMRKELKATNTRVTEAEEIFRTCWQYVSVRLKKMIE